MTEDFLLNISQALFRSAKFILKLDDSRDDDLKILDLAITIRPFSWRRFMTNWQDASLTWLISLAPALLSLSLRFVPMSWAKLITIINLVVLAVILIYSFLVSQACYYLASRNEKSLRIYYNWTVDSKKSPSLNASRLKLLAVRLHNEENSYKS